MSDLPVELYRAEDVRALDRAAIERGGIPAYGLMTRAGEAAFELLRRRWPAARKIVVVCGRGNNGGDGYVLARLARDAGLDARVLTVGSTEGGSREAQTARGDWLDAGGMAEPFQASALAEADVVVDALFGTGLDRAVEGPWREAIEAINTGARAVFSLDIPSGLNADTGATLGVAVQADATVSFIGLKQGLFTARAPDCCGEIHLCDLDVPADIYAMVQPSARRIEPGVLDAHLPPRRRSAHKGEFGHVLVVGGDYGMAGAAAMAAEAAARGGAGLVSVATRPEHAAALASRRPELMCHAIEGSAGLAPLLDRADVVAVGPGLGRSVWARDLLGAVLDSSRPLVADADALNLLAAEPMARGNWVLTPHPGEAARLLGADPDSVQTDRFAAVEALADALQAVVVLKGSGTLVRAPTGLTEVCDVGNPGMASGGMGDVLTGVIAALMAQGLAPLAAAQVGVYAHASAADLAARLGERGLLATDLFEELRWLLNPNPPRARG